METVQFLIKSGANPQKPPEKGVFAGKNALMWAASQGRTEVVKVLLAAGVDVNYVSQSGSFKVKLHALNAIQSIYEMPMMDG